MTGTLPLLFIATLAFVGAHLVVSNTKLRDTLIARLGDGPYKGLYSLLVAALLVWMIFAFINAPYEPVWSAPIGLRHLPLALMPIAFILIIAAQMRGNPATVNSKTAQLNDGPKGIFTITRHPMMWGLALWGALHMAAMGDAAAIIFFGGFIVLALAGTWFIDKKKQQLSGQAWSAYVAATSNIPFVAALTRRASIDWRGIGFGPVIIGLVVYAILLALHETIIGVPPASFLSGLF